jgi:hypothetical protein
MTRLMKLSMSDDCGLVTAGPACTDSLASAGSVSSSQNRAVVDTIEHCPSIGSRHPTPLVTSDLAFEGKGDTVTSTTLTPSAELRGETWWLRRDCQNVTSVT